MLRRLALLGAALCACAAAPVTFSNSLPRRSAAGAIMNAHDGTTRRYTPGGRFFYHAMGCEVRALCLPSKRAP